MLRVGLTGSIAVGKSYVTGLLSKFGCRVIDADSIARRVVEPGSKGLRAVVGAFGDGVVREDGSLDRARLGSMVFSDEGKRALLNELLHPLIIEEQEEILRRWEGEDPEGIAVVDAALMIESGGYKRFRKLIVVHCRPEIQLARLMLRDGLDEDEAARRVASQMPQSEKILYADYAIDTSEGFEDTRRQTVIVYDKLRGLE